MVSLEDLKRMSTEERIRMLKEFEQEKKKEIEEAQKLMAQSEQEIEEKEEIRKKIPIPQVKAVSIESLFSKEEKQVFAAQRFQQEPLAELEQKVEEAGGKEEEERQKYIVELARQPTQDFYNRVMNIREEAERQRQETGYISEETRTQIREAYVEEQQRERAQHEGYNMSATIEEKFNAAKGVVKNLMEWYRG
jgi:hypothetical protein